MWGFPLPRAEPARLLRLPATPWGFPIFAPAASCGSPCGRFPMPDCLPATPVGSLGSTWWPALVPYGTGIPSQGSAQDSLWLPWGLPHCSAAHVSSGGDSPAPDCPGAAHACLSGTPSGSSGDPPALDCSQSSAHWFRTPRQGASLGFPCQGFPRASWGLEGSQEPAASTSCACGRRDPGEGGSPAVPPAHVQIFQSKYRGSILSAGSTPENFSICRG